MAGGGWNITNLSAASTAAGATQVAPSNFAATGMTLRLRSLQCVIAASTAGSGLLQIMSATTVLDQWRMACASGGDGGFLVVSDLDIRANSGESLVVAFASGTPGNPQSVAAHGDMIPVGYPMFQT
jgi:hypothetical protein